VAKTVELKLPHRDFAGGWPYRQRHAFKTCHY
jgi:hypothetical protein